MRLEFTPKTLEIMVSAIAGELVRRGGNHLVQHDELLAECVESAATVIVHDFGWPEEPVREAMHTALVCALVDAAAVPLG